MEFAVIAPTNLLQRYALQRKVQFCLAQHCGNPVYFKFYQDCVKDTRHTVILDNGAYEGTLADFDTISQIANDLQPDMIVLPDVMGDFKVTSYLHKAFRSYWAANQKLYDTDWDPVFMTVLQGGDIWELMQAYRNTPDTEAVGFPRDMIMFARCSRPELIKRLKQTAIWEPRLYHHALGMVDGSVEELRELAVLGVNSCDSSHPVWRSIEFTGDFKVDWNGYVKDYEVAGRLNPILEACKGGTK